MKYQNQTEAFDKVEVWLGKKNYVEVYTKENIYKTIKKAKKKLLKVKMEYNGPVEAPIEKDQIIAKLKEIIYDEEIVGEYNMLALNNVKKVNIFEIIKIIKLFDMGVMSKKPLIIFEGVEGSETYHLNKVAKYLKEEFIIY